MIVPLKLPAGIARPGTKYDARGRWYDANLVRWHEGSLGPVGGWQPIERTASADVAAAISDDGGVFTDETTDANDVGANDVILIPASPAADDAFYIGYGFRFTEVEIDVGTTEAGDVVLAWEYYNGSAWTALSGVSDLTNEFTTSGVNTVSWTLPWDWATTSVNSQGPFYYVRARVVSASGGSGGAWAAGVWDLSPQAWATGVWAEGGGGLSAALADEVSIGQGPVDLDAPVRSMLAWRSNDNTPHLIAGTPDNIYVYSQGALTDVTPVGFVGGNADASTSSGAYGAGAYGTGLYGVGDAAVALITEANTWQLDTYGEDIVACAYSDGELWYWDKSAGGVMTAITNAPSDCLGVVVTPERFIMALGADGDGRKISWPDVEDITDWTPIPNNEADSRFLPGSGQLMAGRRGRNETMFWTDVDMFVARFVGGEFVYEFKQVGSSCGPISRQAMQVMDTVAFWMGHRGFYMYDGFVKPLLSEVGDYVFSDINQTQVSKVTCGIQSEFAEVFWFYPSAASTENDRYVKYDWLENHWTIGRLERTAWVDRGAFPLPIAADAGGVIYQHETGTSYLDHEGETLTPFAESGPIELAPGEYIAAARQWIPDEKTLGDVEVSLYSSMYPTATETLSGPFTAANPTNLRVSGRQVRILVEQVRPNWRFGTPRLDVVQAGKR